MKHVAGIVEIEAKRVGKTCDNLTISQQLWQFGKIGQIVGGHRMWNSAKHLSLGDELSKVVQREFSMKESKEREYL